MRWPWSRAPGPYRETRQASGYTDALVAAILNSAQGGPWHCPQRPRPWKLARA